MNVMTLKSQDIISSLKRSVTAFLDNFRSTIDDSDLEQTIPYHWTQEIRNSSAVSYEETVVTVKIPLSEFERVCDRLYWYEWGDCLRYAPNPTHYYNQQMTWSNYLTNSPGSYVTTTINPLTQYTSGTGDLYTNTCTTSPVPDIQALVSRVTYFENKEIEENRLRSLHPELNDLHGQYEMTKALLLDHDDNNRGTG